MHTFFNLLDPLTSDHTQNSQILFHMKSLSMKWILTTLRKQINLRLFKNFKYNKYLLNACCLYGKDPILVAEGKINVPQILWFPCRGSKSGRNLMIACRENPKWPQVLKSLPLQSSLVLTGAIHLALPDEDSVYGLWSQMAQVQVLTQPNISSVTLDNLFTFSVHWLPHL